jgi:hypothetical protein
MKRLLCSITLLWLALLMLSAVKVAAQIAPSVPRRAGSDEEAARRRDEMARRESARLLDEMSRRADRIRHMPHEPEDNNFYNKKLTDAQKQLLAPSAEDEAAHHEFLRQAHTGLIRLLPRGKYEFNTTVAANNNPDKVLPIRGGGAFYSFAERKHPYGPWSEITLQEGRLLVGFLHQSLGVMTTLGDVPLESLTLTTPGIDYLAQLVPPTEPAAARDQCIRNLQGFSAANHIYNANLPAMVDQTYVLRSIVYKKEGRMLIPPGGGAIYIPHPYEYSGADELIAFRILRASEDGSLTILWKRLQKFSPPRIKRK